MPRSFLVKKPPSGGSSTTTTRGSPSTRRRPPNDGRPEPIGPSLGVGGPLFLQDGTASPEAPMQGGSPWGNRRSIIACLSPPLLPKNELGGDPDLGLPGDARATMDSQALDFKDHQNQSPLPLLPAFSLPQKRTPSLGSPAEGGGSEAMGEPDLAATGAPLERLGCPDCPKPCGLFLGLGRHAQQQQHRHRQLGPARKYFSCKYCDKEYVSLGALKMHIRTHTLPCVCKSCGKAFSRPWLLQGHIRTHTGEKPYACPHCSRAFADRSNLRAHLQTHSEVKKYQCHTCLKTFSRMSLLLRHEEASCSPAAT